MSEDNAPDGGGSYTPPATQDDLNRIIEQRLSRERSRYSDYDDLKAKAAKFDEADAASKSELQKAQDALAERDARLADLPKTIRGQVLRFASVASQKGFLDPEDALVFLGDVDLADNDALSAALDELAERKPHLVKAAPKQKLPVRPKPGAGDDESRNVDSLKGKERAAAALRQMRPH